jgi:hypothetical protein
MKTACCAWLKLDASAAEMAKRSARYRSVSINQVVSGRFVKNKAACRRFFLRSPLIRAAADPQQKATRFH